MTRGQVGPARRLAALFFRAPDPRASAAFILTASLLFGVYPHGVFSIPVFSVFALSALVSAELSPAAFRFFRLDLERGHSYFLSLMSLAAAGIFLAVGALSMQAPVSAAFSLAFVLSLRSVWLRAISKIGFFRSLVPAAAQSLLMAAGLILALPFDALPLLVLFFVLSLAFLALSEALLLFAGAPLRELFGIGLLELSCLVFSNVERGSSGIEGIFRRNAERIKALVSVVGIKGRKGMKAVLVAPFLHPGPFGEIGSAGMPRMVCKELSRRFGCEVFFAKGAGTHDENLANADEIRKVSKKAGSLVELLEFSKKCTFFERQAGALGIRFNGTVLGISTKPSGDVELDAGSGFVDEMKKHAKKAVYIEAHNSFAGKDSAVAAGSFECLELKRSLGAVSKRLSVSKEGRFSVGVGRVLPRLSAREGMGSGGIGVALFSMGRRRFALVFADSNNIASGVREKVISAFRRRGVSDAEVISSDSHSVNTLLERENPLCARGGEDALIGSCLDGLKIAEENLEPCGIGAASGFVDASVFGRGASARILTAVNRTAFRLAAAALSFAAAFVVAGALA